MSASVQSTSRSRRRSTPRVGWRVGRFVALVLVMLAVTATGLYQVHQRYELVRLGYQLDEDRFEHRRLLETNKRLRLSLATWKDPTTVRAMATDQLNMRRAEAYDEFLVPGSAPRDRRSLVAPPPPKREPEAEAEPDPEPAADSPAAPGVDEPTPPHAAEPALPAPIHRDPVKASPLAQEVLP